MDKLALSSNLYKQLHIFKRWFLLRMDLLMGRKSNISERDRMNDNTSILDLIKLNIKKIFSEINLRK